MIFPQTLSTPKYATGLKSSIKIKVNLFAISLSALLLCSQIGTAQAELPTSQVNTTGLAVTDNTVNVGIVNSLTGTMAISETGPVQATRLAIDQINKSGGVLGRQIEYVLEDGASDWPTFAEKAKKLIVNDKVAVLFGGWTSASRKAMLPVLEQYNNMLYYPTFYEGLEESPNVIYTGQEAAQQNLAAIKWLIENKNAKTFYLLGSDYIWPRTTNKIARSYIEKQGLSVIGEEYYPLENTQFNSVINKIKLRKPDVVISTIVAGSNVAFYKQLKAAGIDMTKEKPLLLTFSVTEDEARGIGGENIVGAYSSMKYFQSLDNPNNKQFVEAFKNMWGDDMVIGDVTQASYLGPWLWKAAVEKAGSFDIDKVRAASIGIDFKQAPEGEVIIDKNHHLWSKTRIAQAQADGQFKVIYETKDLVEPNPFPTY